MPSHAQKLYLTPEQQEEVFAHVSLPFRHCTELQESYGAQFPEAIRRIRSDSLLKLPGFASSAVNERVLVPMWSYLQYAFEHFGSDPDAQRRAWDNGTDLRRLSIVGQWSIGKNVGIFGAGNLVEISEADWWRGYTTDWLLERFASWCVFISLRGVTDSEGGTECFGGYYAGFDWFDGQLRLFCQYQVEAGGFGPECFFEYPFPKGISLGEVIDRYEYDLPGFEFLRQKFVQQEGCEICSLDFRELMTEYGQNVGRRLLALLVGMFGEDFEQNRYCVDTQTQEIYRVIEFESHYGDANEPRIHQDITKCNINVYNINYRQKNILN